MRSVHTISLDSESGPRTLSVITHDSGQPGPRIAVTSNIHGDELTGLATVFELDDWLPKHLKSGAVLLYPTLNPVGLEGCHRGLSPRGADLNRLFPGDRRGDLGRRVAAAIWSELEARSLDLLLDLHADSVNAIPYAIVDRAVALSGKPRARMQTQLRATADATGLTVLTEYPDDKYRRFELDKSLAGAMVNRAGIPALTVECGPRRAIQREAVEAMSCAVRGVLGHLGAVSFETMEHPSKVPGHFRRSSPRRILASGVFCPAVRPGERFEKGTTLGWVLAPDGSRLDQILAPDPGVVISWVESSWVQRHGVVGTLGIAE